MPNSTLVNQIKHKLAIYTIYIALASALVLGLVVLIFSTGCNTRSDELNAMLESSVATTQLTTGSEVSRRYQDRDTKPLLGKPKQPEVRIEYEPINNNTKDDVYEEITKILIDNDWKQEDLNIAQPGYYRASLPQSHFTILAEVLIHSNSNIVSVTMVTIPR